MSDQNGDIRLTLRVDGTVDVERGMKLTAEQTQRVADAMKAMGKEAEGATKHVSGMGDKLPAIQNGLAAIAGVVATWQITSKVNAMSDEMTTLHSRIKLVTAGATDQAYVQQRLFGIAQQSRVSYSELGATYGQMARATAELGISQTRLLAVTETIGQAMAISGGSAESMKASLVQLTQGLASGTLRGEELNSVLEQTPRLAQAIAEGMGVSLGALRAMGQDGKLSAQAVIEALEKAGPTLKREFESISPTISQSFVVLTNSATRFVGEMDRAVGRSKNFGDMLKQVSDGVDEFTTRMSKINDEMEDTPNRYDAMKLAGEGIKVVLETVVVLAASTAYVLNGIGREIGGIAAQAGAMMRGDFSGAAEIRRQLMQEAEQSRQELDDYTEKVLGKKGTTNRRAQQDFRKSELGAQSSADNALPWPGAKPIDEVRGYAKLVVDVQRKAYDESVEIAKTYQNRIKTAASDADRVALTKEMNDRLIQVEKDAQKQIKSINEQGAAEAKALAEAQFEVKKARMELSATIERNAIKDQQRSVEQFYKLGMLDVEEYFQRKADLAVQDLDISARLVQAELDQARALERSARRAEDKAQAQARVLGLEKQLVELAGKRKAEAETPANEKAVRDFEREAKLADETHKARRDNTTAGYDLAKQYEEEAKRLQLAAIKDPNEQARRQLEEDLKARRAALAAIQNDDAREMATDKFAAYEVAKNAELAEKLKPGWQKLVEGWSDTTRLMRDSYDSAMDGILKSGEDMFVKLAQTGKLSVRDMVDGVIAEMARLTFRQNLASPLMSLAGNLIGAFFGGGTGDPDGSYTRLENARLGVKHTGGIVGANDAGSRWVSAPAMAQAFSGAPRFHGGGIAADEVPIIAQKGEGIFTREQMAALSPAGGTKVDVQVHNYGGAQVQVKQQQDAAGALRLDVLIDHIDEAMADRVQAGSGTLARAFEGRYGLRTAVA